MSSEPASVLDVQRRRLEELESLLDAVEGGQRPSMPLAPVRSPRDFAELADEAE